MSFTRNPIVGVASTMVFLAGAWFAVSPRVYGAASPPTAFNNWMAGGMIATFAAMRLTQPGSEFASWVNMFLGMWVMASPWIQGYAFIEARLVNTLIVGAVVAVAALVSATARTRRFGV
ncbi:MAG TPA: SPW repeat protein [Bryobacteraceae bacterium]|nr:SPW repeat protein [Bryobacteraceae bacterium]